MKNWEHQDQALAFLDSLPGPGMLAMDMGTGKSRVAVQWLDKHNCDLVLILCPKVVMDVWGGSTGKPSQLKLHSDREWYVHCDKSKKTIAAKTTVAANRLALAQEMGRPFALVMNYEGAWREPIADWILKQKWDAAIYDESHRIKAPGGKGSRFVSRAKRATQRRLALTGTPMPHSPLDLYAQWRGLDIAVFGTSNQRFKSRYAVIEQRETREGKPYNEVVDYQNLDELMDLAGARTFRVNKRDVMDLPPVIKDVIPVDLSHETIRAYREFEKELVLEFDGAEVTANNALVKFLRLQQICSGYVKSDEGQLIRLGTDKESVTQDLISDIPHNEPVVCFCRFTRDLQAVSEVAADLKRDYFEISGKVNSLEFWQRRTKGEILGVQIQSGSMGVDLTRANYGIYYSLGLSLGDYDQSVARLDREGQTQPVNLYHLIGTDPGTDSPLIDGKVFDGLQDKADIVRHIMAGFGGYIK